MIYVSHQLPVNAPGEPQLDRAALWDGLVLKANNALPFVPSMTYCEVIERHDDTVFERSEQATLLLPRSTTAPVVQRGNIVEPRAALELAEKLYTVLSRNGR